MKKIIIPADAFDEVVAEIPKTKTNYTKVFESLQKHTDGLTSNELAEKSGVLARRVTEAIKRMKHENIVKEKPCRCKRTAIYFL